MIFNLHVSLSLPQQSSKLLQTCARWRRLWERGMDSLPPEHRSYLGIAKNIPDVEHLSRHIVEVAVSSKAGSSRYLQRVPSYSAREIHDFIREFATGSCS